MNLTIPSSMHALTCTQGLRVHPPMAIYNFLDIGHRWWSWGPLWWFICAVSHNTPHPISPPCVTLGGIWGLKKAPSLDQLNSAGRDFKNNIFFIYKKNKNKKSQSYVDNRLPRQTAVFSFFIFHEICPSKYCVSPPTYSWYEGTLKQYWDFVLVSLDSCGRLQWQGQQKTFTWLHSQDNLSFFEQ